MWNGQTRKNPQDGERSAGNERESDRGRQWVEGKCLRQVTAEKCEGGAGGSARRAGHSGPGPEDARPQGGRDGEPQWPQQNGRHRRNQPQENQLTIFRGRVAGPQRDEATPASTPMKVRAATKPQHRTTGRNTAIAALPRDVP